MALGLSAMSADEIGPVPKRDDVEWGVAKLVGDAKPADSLEFNSDSH